MDERERLRVRLPAVAASIPTIRHELVAYARAFGGRDGQISDVAMGVTEAVTNAVLHGYPNGESGHVEVEAVGACSGLEVTVRDDGCGPSRRSRNPGLGMGVPLMKSVADRFQVDGDEHGTTVRMRFNLGS